MRTSIADLPMHVSGSIEITYHMSKEILRQVINLLDDSSIGLNKHILMLYPFKWNFQNGVCYCFDTSYQLRKKFSTGFRGGRKKNCLPQFQTSDA